MSASFAARWRRRTGEPGFRFWAFVALIALIFATGGGARGDILSLVVLRPMAAVFAAFAVAHISRDQLRSVRIPLVFVVLAAALIAMQLVPLPPALWTSLPARELYAHAYQAAGMPLPWQPLATAPSRAWNSLFSLVVPLAVLLNYAILPPARRGSALTVLWAAAIASVFLGILQLLGSPSGPLYLYRITNNGLPVGLFANRNHQALMVAIGILLSAVLLVRGLGKPRLAPPLIVGAGGAILIFTPFLLVTGSRGGLAMGLAMLVVSAVLVLLAVRKRERRSDATRSARTRGRWIAALSLAALSGVVAAMLWFSRSLAFDRLMQKDVELDLRLQVMPVVLDIARRQLPFGSGFGSFESIYQQFEPFALLMPSYLNQAHNDWLQIVIEGGAPAVLLLLGFIAWLAHAVFRLARRDGKRLSADVIASAVIICAIGAFSILDYPLRTPALMTVFAICCAQIASSRSER
jgi:O-antigen ligase